MTSTELQTVLDILKAAHVSSASIDMEAGKVVVAFEPEMPTMLAGSDPEPGAWKTVTPSTPPTKLDLQPDWSDEPRQVD